MTHLQQITDEMLPPAVLSHSCAIPTAERLAFFIPRLSATAEEAAITSNLLRTWTPHSQASKVMGGRGLQSSLTSEGPELVSVVD